MFAAWYPDMTGEPWHPIDDARLLQDYAWGCSVFTMAKRARRPEHEIAARLIELEHPLDRQPAPRKIRCTTWTRR